MNMSVRPIRANDDTRWGELWQGFLVATEMVLPAAITQTTWRRLINPDEQPFGLLATDENDRVLGFAHYLFHRSSWTDGSHCYLEDLFVDPAGRRSGAARALVLAVEAEAREKGCEEMYLVTDNDNTAARKLYDQVMEKTPFIEYRTVLS